MQLFGRNFVVLRAFAKIRNGALEFGEREPFSVADDGNQQTFFRADRHSNVVVIFVDDLVLTDFGVELRGELQGVDHSLDEKRHKP